jgi:hypothetical protein
MCRTKLDQAPRETVVRLHHDPRKVYPICRYHGRPYDPLIESQPSAQLNLASIYGYQRGGQNNKTIVIVARISNHFRILLIP